MQEHRGLGDTLAPLFPWKVNTALGVGRRVLQSESPYGTPFAKILYLTDLAQKLLSLHILSYLYAEIAISARI